MFSSPAHRRLSVLVKILCKANSRNGYSFCNALSCNKFHSEGATTVSIGDVKRVVDEPERYEYVPRKYLSTNLDQETLHHLRWMLQKDELGQDMFLLGRPGPSRRNLAMQYSELTKREIEFVSLSRDTTEADLKQRREIKAGTAKYFDQSAVRAAVAGRILILEGIEKAERNVLPILNNLLENREMHLEDGRFLIPASRYDKLLKEHGKNEIEQWHLLRASEKFRVIALGLPVPGYHGNPLDPPLRSRFQARDIVTIPYRDKAVEVCSDDALHHYRYHSLHCDGSLHWQYSSNPGSWERTQGVEGVCIFKGDYNIIYTNENNEHLKKEHFELCDGKYHYFNLCRKKRNCSEKTVFKML